jgi:hypothetical protein
MGKVQMQAKQHLLLQLWILAKRIGSILISGNILSITFRVSSSDSESARRDRVGPADSARRVAGGPVTRDSVCCGQSQYGHSHSCDGQGARPGRAEPTAPGSGRPATVARGPRGAAARPGPGLGGPGPARRGARPALAGSGSRLDRRARSVTPPSLTF